MQHPNKKTQQQHPRKKKWIYQKVKWINHYLFCCHPTILHRLMDHFMYKIIDSLILQGNKNEWVYDRSSCSVIRLTQN